VPPGQATKGLPPGWVTLRRYETPTLNGQAPASADDLVVALWPLVPALACRGKVGQAVGGYTNLDDVPRDDLEVFPGAKSQAIHDHLSHA
jgi:hypothetical protein